MAAVYHDPWITSLKMDESNIAKLLAAGGFEPNLVHYRAIISAFTGLHVGLDRN